MRKVPPNKVVPESIMSPPSRTRRIAWGDTEPAPLTLKIKPYTLTQVQPFDSSETSVSSSVLLSSSPSQIQPGGIITPSGYTMDERTDLIANVSPATAIAGAALGVPSALFPTAAPTSGISIAGSVGGLGLGAGVCICDAVALAQAIKKRDVAGVGFALAGLSCDTTTMGLNIVNQAGALSSSATVAVPGVGLGASCVGFAASLKQLMEFTDRHSAIALFLLGYRGACQRAMLLAANDLPQLKIIGSILAMLEWLLTKYRHCVKGAIALLANNTAQVIVAAVTLALFISISAATAGIAMAVGAALGLIYLAVAVGVKIFRARRSALTLRAYESELSLRSMSEFSLEEAALERRLCVLARNVHPIRHRLTGATWGDYMRIKIAHFILSTKRDMAIRYGAALERASGAKVAWDEKMASFECIDVFSEAIGFADKLDYHVMSSWTDEYLVERALHLAQAMPVSSY